jgi:hypothetical protein
MFRRKSEGKNVPRNLELPAQQPTPVRGALDIVASAASPQTTAGNAFSIFVRVQNPFEVTIRLFQVRTHIPVELEDVGPAMKEELRRADADAASKRRLKESGIALAQITGPTEFGYFPVTGHDETGEAYDAGYYAFNNPFVDLQPGDSVIQQFVLRTKQRLLFTPLTHTFHIQVSYSEVGDKSPKGVVHSRTLPFELSIGADLWAIMAGGVVGAIGGALLKTLTAASTSNPSPTLASFLLAAAIAVIASAAVVIGFARKASAQPFVSIEDFWGGTLVGFSVGFIGYDQFSSLFTAPSVPTQ